MWKAIYESPIHHPVLAWLAGACFLAYFMRRRPFLTAYVALFTVEILADALLTGAYSPAAKTRWETPFGIAFVILGDFRYFLLVERFARAPLAAPQERTRAAAWAAAIAFAFGVPVASTIARSVVTMPSARWTFLTYEAMFLALALALRLIVLPKRLTTAPERIRRWLLFVTSFEVAQYALWAFADVVILSNNEVGYLIRLLPNVLYYVAFVPMVALSAPSEEDV